MAGLEELVPIRGATIQPAKMKPHRSERVGSQKV